jgi:hypothetical protein
MHMQRDAGEQNTELVECGRGEVDRNLVIWGLGGIERNPELAERPSYRTAARQVCVLCARGLVHACALRRGHGLR